MRDDVGHGGKHERVREIFIACADGLFDQQSFSQLVCCSGCPAMPYTHRSARAHIHWSTQTKSMIPFYLSFCFTWISTEYRRIEIFAVVLSCIQYFGSL